MSTRNLNVGPGDVVELVDASGMNTPTGSLAVVEESLAVVEEWSPEGGEVWLVVRWVVGRCQGSYYPHRFKRAECKLCGGGLVVDPVSDGVVCPVCAGCVRDPVTGWTPAVSRPPAGNGEGHGKDDPEAGTKDTNPKDAVGSTKLPLHLVPSLTVAYAAVAHLNGALKYGKANWREAGVRASIYIDAAMRHLAAWAEGEEDDPDDGVPHLAAVLACVGIILDARAAGKLTDDRSLENPGFREEVAKLTKHVGRLKKLHKKYNPKHFTIRKGQ